MILAGVRSEPAFGFMLVALIILFGPALAQKARLPGLIGLLVGGALIGPNMLGVLENSTALEGFGGIGVLYLVFMAGLELDLKTFQRYQRASMSFGLITAAVPWILGTIVALAFDFEIRPAILIGSFWASFTLVSYSVVSQYKLTRVPSVAATVGASAITDTIGLVALAVIVGAETGGSGGIRLAFEITAGLIGVVVYALVVLPAVVRWFFAGLGRERELRFVMVLAGFTSAAVVADALGIEALIGAFFAGVGLNRLVPNQSALMARTGFFGNALFIPAFIVSVGLLVDPEVIANRRTLGLAAGFAVALVVGKATAALVTSKLYSFPRAETGLMFSLSTAQAAATLASTIIGFEIGLYEADVVNAVMVVIVISLFVSAVGSARFAPRIKRPSEKERRLGEAVLVPSTDDGELTDVFRVAGQLTESDGGLLIPLVVATEDSDTVLSTLRCRIEQLDTEIRGLGLVGEPLLRVDRSIAGGVARAAVERDASLVVVPWSPNGNMRKALLGSTVDEIVASADRPIVLAWVTTREADRLLVPIDDEDLKPGNRDDVLMALSLASSLAARRKLPVVVGPVEVEQLQTDDLELQAMIESRPGPGDRRDWLDEHGIETDLIVIGARGQPEPLLRAERLRGRSALVVSAHNHSRWYSSEGALRLSA